MTVLAPAAISLLLVLGLAKTVAYEYSDAAWCLVLALTFASASGRDRDDDSPIG